MSVMERRLQLLLDQARYDRVASEAERSGRSVAAVIREAIDFRYPVDDRAAAARELLAMTSTPGGEEGVDPAELKAAYELELLDRLPAP